MKRTRHTVLLHATFAAILVVAVLELSSALRSVEVIIPPAVKKGENALLICRYDIENDTLYTVKWYRGRREFYRYTPKENPAWKIFPSTTNGIDVDTMFSNASHVLLRNLPLSLSGKFACEISADAPSFQTSIMAAELEVVELPPQRPIITGIHARYRLGDVINGNCSSDFSKPAANLTWFINDMQVPADYVRNYAVSKHADEQMESAITEIKFIATIKHFIRNRLKLKCSARIHNIYNQESEKIIEEDRPHILASGRSEMNIYSFDQSSIAAGGGHNGQNELYMTEYSDKASSASNIYKQSFFSNNILLKPRRCLSIILYCFLLSIIAVISDKKASSFLEKDLNKSKSFYYENEKYSKTCEELFLDKENYQMKLETSNVIKCEWDCKIAIKGR